MSNRRVPIRVGNRPPQPNKQANESEPTVDQIDPAYMELVQLHERMWGTEQYPNRPTLAQLLSAAITVMWIDLRTISAARPKPLPSEEAKRGYFKLEIYNTIEELNEVLKSVLLADKVTEHQMRKLSKIYARGKQIEITGVRLQVKLK
jgi:hypothetical protein